MIAAKDEGGAALSFQSGVGSGNEALCGGFFVTGCAVDLSGEVEVFHLFGFEGWVELSGRCIVVFDGIAGPDELSVFKAGNAADDFALNVVGQGGGDAVQVVFLRAAAFGFEKDLVLLFFGKADDFVFDGGAVARADSLDDASVEGAVMEVFPYDVVGAPVGVGDPARILYEVEAGIGKGVECAMRFGVASEFGEGAVAEEGRRGVAVLAFARAEVDGVPVDAGRGAGFETFEADAEAA